MQQEAAELNSWHAHTTVTVHLWLGVQNRCLEKPQTC